MAGQPQLTVTEPISLSHFQCYESPMTGSFFGPKIHFSTWYNGKIENFKMQWLLDQSFND